MPQTLYCNKVAPTMSASGPPYSRMGQCSEVDGLVVQEREREHGVRRIMPIEAERLQGFPDNYTNIPGASDTARYKALGNSMAVPVVRWIAKRMLEVDRQMENM